MSQIPTDSIASNVGVKTSINPTTIEMISGGAAGTISSNSSSNQNYIPAEAVLALQTKLIFSSTVGTITFTPFHGFTGRVVVPVVEYESGSATVVFHNVTVAPAVVPVANFAPTSSTKSLIRWDPSPSDVKGYKVTINGVEVCSTVSTSCTISTLIGPKTVVLIQAIGNDQTKSTLTPVAYLPLAPVKVLSSQYPNSSSKLSAQQIKQLKALAKVVQKQGFTRIVCVGHTDSTSKDSINIPLSKARAATAAAYLKKILKGVTISSRGEGSLQPIASNKSAAGKAKNRRTDFLIW